jgi:hypothetical protein
VIVVRACKVRGIRVSRSRDKYANSRIDGM